MSLLSARSNRLKRKVTMRLVLDRDCDRCVQRAGLVMNRIRSPGRLFLVRGKRPFSLCVFSAAGARITTFEATRTRPCRYQVRFGGDGWPCYAFGFSKLCVCGPVGKYMVQTDTWCPWNYDRQNGRTTTALQDGRVFESMHGECRVKESSP